MKQKNTAKYAIPCAFGFNGEIDEGFFFLTFNTNNEKEAYALARCVCGEMADKALVILGQEGEIFQL